MSVLTDQLTLRDGCVVRVRPLERTDRKGVAAAVRGLSEQTRYLRFATAKPYLSERELDVLLDIDHHGREALLAVDPRTGDGVAVVRYVEVPGEPHAVEIAATVVDEWQGRGLGGALLTELVERAREEGYSALRASVLAGNQRSIAMLRRAGFTPRPSQGVLREYELALEDPLPATRVDVGLRVATSCREVGKKDDRGRAGGLLRADGGGAVA